MTWQQRITTALEKRRAAEAFRVRTVVEGGAGRFLIREQRQFCNFSSNDYLGLSQHPAIVRAWQEGAEQYAAAFAGVCTPKVIVSAATRWANSFTIWLPKWPVAPVITYFVMVHSSFRFDVTLIVTPFRFDVKHLVSAASILSAFQHKRDYNKG